MATIPSALQLRLTPAERSALVKLLEIADDAIRHVYAANVGDYLESRGDDAQLFGLKIWKHIWYELDQALLDEPELRLVALNGSYEIHVGPLRIGVYGLGHLAEEDALQCFPDSSPLKRSFGEANQLRLFKLETVQPPTEEAGLALNDLTIGHFGNPRDGLVKWYLGAWAVDDVGVSRWAWLERQDDAEEGLEPLPARPQIAAYSERTPEPITVRARRPA